MAQLRLTHLPLDVVVERAGPLRWPTPECAGGVPLDLVGKLATWSPDLGIAVVERASVNGSNSWITAHGGVLTDATWFGPAFEAEAPPEPVTTTDEHLPGISLSLLSDFANHNYGHLVYDCLPRLDLASRAGVRLDEIDHVLCWGPASLMRLYNEIGVPAERIVHVQPGVRYRCDQLIATSFPGVRRALAPWAAEFLRSTLRRPAEGAHRRLWLQRTTTRLLRNDAELEPVLRARGFEFLDPGTDGVATRAAFAAADIVVSAHGAGLADLVFCPPHTQIVELVPSDHPYPYWYAASVACGLDYRYLSCTSVGHRGRDALGPSPHDFECDPHALAAALDAALG